ncbi:MULTISPECIES: glutamate-1-semialdehyde 2,1-aminomutase [unclassified Streptococcus]|uniref:glutamate-1-semialdehyde 2,1-aminomutase n=1 Tax=unclassified Streptococcus TaxID=2608887 RepID=UPI00107267CA|nr:MULTISPECIES: glutamate-1-semialdehyde 2,1-aminomutase [unclassified Streptococcus]MBF0805561.1 glutamate-1-semialdehyde 2,1-aminomutase [Streptococcus sp. 19428wA2_WM07]TFU28929.1 glutamate-1-semialdehyde-2,1-aminomutase [Streptococcus sp. WM07]
MKTSKSQAYFQQAQEVFPGGVNSPVRSFQAVGGEPLCIAKAQGSYIEDIDGNRYIDYVLSWGPMILGHAPKTVLEAVNKSLSLGTSFGAPCQAELDLGLLLKERLPYLEKVRMVNSGTEATMSAIRLARGVTGRKKIVKFIGCYHGHSDSFLVQAGSGVASLGMASSAGILPELAQETIALPFNDLEALEAVFEAYASDIAGVIVEAVAGNMGLVPGTPTFLQGIQKLCKKTGALFIVDEVMTGFRVHIQGAVGLFGLEPDLVCLGKVIGSGFPVAAFGGKAIWMDQVAPLGPVYQAGTLSGNPIAMTAGYAGLSALTSEVFKAIVEKTSYLVEGLQSLVEQYQMKLQVLSIGTMFGFFCSDKPVTNFELSQASDHELFTQLYNLLLNEGIYLAPSPYEANFLSAAHTWEDLQETLTAFEMAFKTLKEG